MATPNELVHLLDLAVSAAHGAGSMLLDMFQGQASGVTSKSSATDLVSDADRKAETYILSMLQEHRPADGILSEEGGDAESTSGYTWVIDPLDGTINYLFRIPVWAVSIAVEDYDGAVVGVVHNPNAGETFTAVRAQGAHMNGRQVHVSTRDDLATALVGTGFSYDAEARADQAEMVRRVIPRVRDIRRSGSAALDLCSLASGRLDGFYEAPMEPWDKAAGQLIIEEAGGVTSILEGPRDLSPGLIAAGPSLHGSLEKLVRGDG
jgi:myo-inositol-1(or 4)-monophosphatase